MDREFLDYYNRELVFLREMGKQFAAANPGVAGLLELSADGSEDPHVERLLQSFAFLAARIRKKLDDEYPEISNALLSVIFPHYLRPVPSMTVVQFTVAGDATKAVAGQLIPRGTRLRSVVAIEDVRCQFQTSYPVTLWPITVESASLVPDRVIQAGKPSGAASLLKLVLNCNAPGGWPALQGLGSLRFFLGGNEPVPSLLYECLFSQVCEIWIQGQSPTRGPFKKVLRPQAVTRVGFEAGDQLYPSAADGEGVPGELGRVGFDPGEQLSPFPEHAFPGYRLLQDFFSFPAKYLFFDLRLADGANGGENLLRAAGIEGPVEVSFWLNQAPRHEIVVRPDNFRLGCTPAVNLFSHSPEPIDWNQYRTEYPLVPDVRRPTAYEVFAVDWVRSSGSYLEQESGFEPFYAMRHVSSEPDNPSRVRGRRREPREEERTAYWFASRQPSMRDEEGTEVVLSFTDSRFNPFCPAVEKITTRLTCSNRDLPPKLPFGGDQGVLEPEAEMAVGMARMLMKPTPPLRPPLGRSAQWRLVSHLSLNHLSLLASPRGADALRELLTLYDFARTATTRKMIEGVVEVSHARIAGRVSYPEPAAEGATAQERARRQRLKGKPLSLGLEIALRFDEDAFSGGMAYLLASVLDRFFGAYVSINSFIQLVASSKQREVNWRWPARSGDRTLL